MTMTREKMMAIQQEGRPKKKFFVVNREGCLKVATAALLAARARGEDPKTCWVKELARLTPTERKSARAAAANPPKRFNPNVARAQALPLKEDPKVMSADADQLAAETEK